MTHTEAVSEFKEASAAVRRAYAAHHDARMGQILADLAMAKATENLTAAQDRLAAADEALRHAEEPAPPPPADIDASRGAWADIHAVPAIHASGNGVAEAVD